MAGERCVCALCHIIICICHVIICMCHIIMAGEKVRLYFVRVACGVQCVLCACVACACACACSLSCTCITPHCPRPVAIGAVQQGNNSATRLDGSPAANPHAAHVPLAFLLKGCTRCLDVCSGSHMSVAPHKRVAKEAGASSKA